MAASAQPPSAFALVESALLPLSGDGRILNKCLDYFGDTPTILMALLDGGADGDGEDGATGTGGEAGDDGEDDGEDGATGTGTAGPIWSHVVSFMDAFTLASLEMTCRDAYFADKWKTDDRWVEWDQMLFDHAKGTHTTSTGAALLCQSEYTRVYRWSRRHNLTARWLQGAPDCDWTSAPLPEVFERDGESRYRVLHCAEAHLSRLYGLFDMWPFRRRDNVADCEGLCDCPIDAVVGNKSHWRKIPVLIRDILARHTEPTPLVSNLR